MVPPSWWCVMGGLETWFALIGLILERFRYPCWDGTGAGR